jgi:enamine deaminase RidA (YjgF/YER057c/UK114 family)
MKITHINPDSMLKNSAFSQAVMVGDAKKIVYIGEQNGVDASGVVVGDDLESQTEQAYKNVLEVLSSVGATQENVVKQTILVAKGQDIRAGYAAAQRVWGAHPTSHNCPYCRRLWHPGALVGLEAVCAPGE